METCPCGSGLAYSACCEPLINGERPAETAESLLRSRYSAYNAKVVEYIIETTHPEQKQPDTRTTIESWAENTLWHKLEILECVDGGPKDDAGTVEFIAEYTEKGKRQKHHELAEFRRKDEKWYFFDAHVPKVKQVIRSAPKTGRNDPCPCGSGKKYKKCCAA